MYWRTQRALASVSFRDVGPQARLGLVAHTSGSPRQLDYPGLQALRVVRFGDPVQSKRLSSVLAFETGVQPFWVEYPPHQGIAPRPRLGARLLLKRVSRIVMDIVRSASGYDSPTALLNLPFAPMAESPRLTHYPTVKLDTACDLRSGSRSFCQCAR